MKSSVVSSLSCSSSAVKILPQENICGPQQLPASAENGCSGMFQKIHGGSGSHVKKARDMFEQSSASAKPPTPPKPDFVQKPRYETNFLMNNLLSLSDFCCVLRQFRKFGVCFYGSGLKLFDCLWLNDGNFNIVIVIYLKTRDLPGVGLVITFTRHFSQKNSNFLLELPFHKF